MSEIWNDHMNRSVIMLTILVTTATLAMAPLTHFPWGLALGVITYMFTWVFLALPLEHGAMGTNWRNKYSVAISWIASLLALFIVNSEYLRTKETMTLLPPALLLAITWGYTLLGKSGELWMRAILCSITALAIGAGVDIASRYI